MVKTTPNAQHCPSPAPGGFFGTAERGVRLCLLLATPQITPNYPKGSLEGSWAWRSPVLLHRSPFFFFLIFPPRVWGFP